MEYKPGTIIKGKMRHRAAILGYTEDNEPIAVMLTSSREKRYPCNLQMKKEHFEEGHLFGWRGDDNPSFMVRHKFLKIREWGPFRRVGSLTPVGITFVKKNTSSQPVIYWRDYFDQPCEQHRE